MEQEKISEGAAPDARPRSYGTQSDSTKPLMAKDLEGAHGAHTNPMLVPPPPDTPAAKMSLLAAPPGGDEGGDDSTHLEQQEPGSRISPKYLDAHAGDGFAYGAIGPSGNKGSSAAAAAAATTHTDIGLHSLNTPQSSDELVHGCDSDLDALDDGDTCGWGSYQPDCLQLFRSTKVVLLFLCLAGAIQGMVINGFISVVISTIEKRFDLASTETGMIASSYDVASVLCLIPVTYFGGTGHKPRWLGFGILLLGLGSFLFSLPHFTTTAYYFETREAQDMCRASLPVNTTAASAAAVCSLEETPQEKARRHLSNYKYIFIIAQLLHGAGATPLYTLGVTYLDENLKPKVAPLYHGVFYSMAVIGPSIGYVLGGELLKYYCDTGVVDLSRLELTGPADSRWVGAWWIGFLFSGTLACILCIPILAFPRTLPGSVKLKAQREAEVYRGSEGDTEHNPNFGLSFKDIPASLKILFSNPTYLSLCFACACEGLLVSGFIVFTPKFVESQFSLSAGWAAQIVGFATIPAGGGGTFIGGYLVKRFDLKCVGIFKLCLATSSTTMVLILIFLVRCSNVSFAGVNVNYAGDNRTLDYANLSAACNTGCHCNSMNFEPVCGIDQVMYFSPCHAGCANASKSLGGKTYQDCSCIVSPSEADLMGLQYDYQGIDGKCSNGCELLAFFLPVFALIIFITFTTSMPALSATLRCVPQKQRSFALGIQWLLARCLGTIPAPILFGALIDKTCQLWQTNCDQQGACYFYDNYTMSSYLLVLAIMCKGMSFFFFFLALVMYKPPPPAMMEINVLPSMPGKTSSVSSTMQMLAKDQLSLDSRLSVGAGSVRSLSDVRGSTNGNSGVGGTGANGGSATAIVR